MRTMAFVVIPVTSVKSRYVEGIRGPTFGMPSNERSDPSEEDGIRDADPVYVSVS